MDGCPGELVSPANEGVPGVLVVPSHMHDHFIHGSDSCYPTDKHDCAIPGMERPEIPDADGTVPDILPPMTRYALHAERRIVSNFSDPTPAAARHQC